MRGYNNRWNYTTLSKNREAVEKKTELRKKKLLAEFAAYDITRTTHTNQDLHDDIEYDGS